MSTFQKLEPYFNKAISLLKDHPYVSGFFGGYFGLYSLTNYVIPFFKKKKNGYSSNTTGEAILKDISTEIWKGKVALVTGANVGLGKETAYVLSLIPGLKVVLAGRNKQGLEDAKKDILSRNKNADLDSLIVDLGDLSSIKNSIQEFEKKNLPLNLLVLNAGYMSPVREETKDGFECSIGINHLGHFSFTLPLLSIMNKSEGEKRVVVLSSALHQGAEKKILWDDFQMKKEYSGYQPRYSHSKLANVMFANELQRKLTKDGIDITVNSVHPGVIQTELHRKDSIVFHILSGFLLLPVAALFRKNIYQGVATTIYGSVHPELKGKGGLYLSNCGPEEPLEYAKNQEECEKLWKLSEELTKVEYKNIKFQK